MDHRVVLIKNEFRLIQIVRRREMHIENPPSSLDLAAIYSASYFEGTAQSGYHHNVFANKENQIKKAQRKVERIQRYLSPHSYLLDVGCGPGFFVCEARKAGFRVDGCDVAPAAAEYARRELGLEIETHNFLEIADREEIYEGIAMFSVLEHTLSPEQNLQKAHRLLKKGGLLALSIPNAWGITRHIKGKDWRGFSFPEHLHFWGKREMTALLESAGFTNVKAPLKENNFFRDTVYYYAWKE